MKTVPRHQFSTQSRSLPKQNNNPINSPLRKGKNLNYFEETLLNNKKMSSSSTNLRKLPHRNGS